MKRGSGQWKVGHGRLEIYISISMSHCKENLAESLQWWPLACGHGAHFPGSSVYCEVDLLSSSANQSEKVMQKIDLSGSGII